MKKVNNLKLIVLIRLVILCPKLLSSDGFKIDLGVFNQFSNSKISALCYLMKSIQNHKPDLKENQFL